MSSAPQVLEFILRRAYGKDRYYPCGPVSGVIVHLTGRKCLKDVEIKRLEFAGFTILLKEEASDAHLHANGT